jgi:hypothetical protein
VHARGLVDVVAGHMKPDESDKTRKDPYLAHQLSVFRNHRLVNLVDYALGLGWLCKEDTRMYTDLDKMSLYPVASYCLCYLH